MPSGRRAGRRRVRRSTRGRRSRPTTTHPAVHGQRRRREPEHRRAVVHGRRRARRRRAAMGAAGRRPLPRRLPGQGQRQLAASSTCPAAGSTTARCPSGAMPTRTTRSPTAIVPPRPDHARGISMKVTVDFDVCASTGACMQVCPEVFEVRSDGYLYILQEDPAEELRDKVQRRPTCAPPRRSPSRTDRHWMTAIDVLRAARGRRPGRCCASGSTPTRRGCRCPSTVRPTRSMFASAARSSTPPPTWCARSSRRSPTSRHSAPRPSSSGCATTSATRTPTCCWCSTPSAATSARTAEHYAREAFERYGAHAVTVNPYLGTDSVEPFLRHRRHGVLRAVPHQQPRRRRLPDRCRCVDGEPLYLHVAAEWPREWTEIGECGLVVGATYPGRTAPRCAASWATCRSWSPASARRAATSQATVEAGATSDGCRPDDQLVAGGALRLERAATSPTRLEPRRPHARSDPRHRAALTRRVGQRRWPLSRRGC